MLKVKAFAFIILIVNFSALTISAQDSTGNLLNKDLSPDSLSSDSSKRQPVNKILSDSTAFFYHRNAKGLVIIQNEWTPFDASVSFRDTMFYNPAYLPVIFDGNILPDNLDFREKDPMVQNEQFHLISPDSTLAPTLRNISQIKKLRRDYYMNLDNIKHIEYSKYNFPESVKEEEKTVKKKSFLDDLLSTEDPVSIVTPEVKKFVPKIVYWTKRGDHLLQVAQNYISDNWTKGGNSSFYIRNYHKLNFDYKKDKITFNNTFEWKLGIQSTSGDTLRDFNINEDLLRIYSVFGYKAFDKWSYSASLEVKTQLFNAYKENQPDRKASFLSPLELNLGLGMSYSIDKKFENNITKNIKFSVNISPLALDYKYVRDDKVDPKLFGIEEGKKSKVDYGSTINANLDYKFNNFVSWTSRFKYFSDYKRVESEFENRLNMALNRYLSTTINLYLRFDDNVPPDPKLKYFQVNELVSFGFNYKW